jgi:hypothetical protein
MAAAGLGAEALAAEAQALAAKLGVTIGGPSDHRQPARKGPIGPKRSAVLDGAHAAMPAHIGASTARLTIVRGGDLGLPPQTLSPRGYGPQFE